MTRTGWASLVMVGVLTMVPLPGASAQQASDSAGVGQQTGAASSTETMPLEQLLPMTVHEAWVASGRNEDKFYAMVSQLTELSAQKRGVTLPNNMEAGQRAGKTFKKIARKDPGQLLYVVVDMMVRKVGEKSATNTAAS